MSFGIIFKTSKSKSFRAAEGGLLVVPCRVREWDFRLVG